ncbi:MAG: aminotransferase class V-fold PLP-dependent enzyme [Pirellulaceae bacterium]|nr:aminotransferase class V-fold PLP-dependent enzyme [Planctomycetaceae bacterium]
MASRIYVDNAATSWPKPPGVAEAVGRYLTEVGAPAGRSGYAEALEVDRLVDATRRQLARIIGVAEADSIAFTANGTDALNLALFGLLRSGDRVVTTVAEHNSVLRPLRYLEENRGIEVVRCPCDDFGRVHLESIDAALEKTTRMVVLTHASNVTGALQPVLEVSERAHAVGAVVLVDAAQALGHLDVDVQAIGADLLAAPTHKGLFSPSGLGFLYAAPDLHRQWQSTRCGGTGTFSDDDRQPTQMPSLLEVGSPNICSIAGLNAALSYFESERSIASIADHESNWSRHLRNRLAELDCVHWISPADDSSLAVISFQLRGFDPQEIAAMMDAIGRVQARAGFHCAPLMHRHMGTDVSGGTIRISGGAFNSMDQIDIIVETIESAVKM